MSEPSREAAVEAGDGRVTSLPRPADGLLARLALISEAERTLDLQYYLWDSDAVGYLLLNRLLDAADRGVRVRVLADDMKLRSRTHNIASLNWHPNLEVRVFNPWSRRSSMVAQAYEFVRRFQVLDTRMHNKLLVADDRRAVFGGRNIADEHFGLGKTFNLVDYDLLLTGSRATDFRRVFEAYWTSDPSVSAASLQGPVSDRDLAATRRHISEELEKRRSTLSTVLREEEDGWDHRAALGSFPLAERSLGVVSDTPGVSRASRRTQVISALRDAVNRAQRDLVVITPFFVPTEVEVDWYRQIIERGVGIRVLTNSLASNEGTISNSGLKKQRRAMVEAGVELHELRTDAADKAEWETPPRVARYLGLHAKLYVIDQERVFLGSVNLDPRSRSINTEMGVLIDNPEFATTSAAGIIGLMTPDNAWRVTIGDDGRLQWRSGTATLHRQPARGVGQRVADTVFGLLPVRDYV